jgi:hypothetical protein
MTTQEKIWLTPEQAIAMLPDTKYIHTFYSVGLGLIGADHSRESLLEKIKTCKLEIGGKSCKSMNHGLVLWETDNTPLFVECKNGFDYEKYEKTLTN